MTEQVIVICGRPNVGKSTLFNAIIRRRVAIVDAVAGVTRDRVTAHVERGEREFMIVDTGGIGAVDAEDLKADIKRQIDTALELADMILFLVDAQDGLVTADSEIARALRTLGKPILLVANKCDGISKEKELPAFFSLGLGDPWPVSAVERFGVEDLLEEIVELLPPVPEDESSEGQSDAIRLAVVGKVNSGKSTLVNLLVGEERVIVSDRPGTTRDAVDAPFERVGQKFIAVDTAGIRKRRVVEGTPDFYGQARAAEAIRRSDVVLLLVDASRKISQVDKAIATQAVRSARPVVIGVSKWDLAREEGQTSEQYLPYIEQQLPMLEFAPICLLSSKELLNVDETLKVVASVCEQSKFRVSTGVLNRTVEKAFTQQFPRVSRGRFPKILYATQTGTCPPTFVVFVNDRKLFGSEYARYLANRFRDELPFAEVPMQIYFRDRRKRSER